MLIVDKNKRGSGILIEETSRAGNTPLEIVVGVDAGSTQTRVCIADNDDARLLLSEEVTAQMYEALRSRVYIIPSTFAVVGDEREIQANSANLEDNYDSHVILVKNGAVKPLVGSDRIIRGQKLLDASGLAARYLDSSTNKMDNSIFYINVLDGIGYALLQKYSGNIPAQVKIHLVISVRPKELNSVCQRQMNENFLGDFIFRWSNTSIQLHIADAQYTTEPEAQIMGTAAIMDMAAVITKDVVAQELSEKFSTSDSYIHVEGGGSSIGVEVIKNGNIIDSCSATFQLGGNYLVRVVIDRLRETKGRTVSEESVREAIKTCLLRNGREREDISEVIAFCKNQVGLDIFERLRHEVIDVTPDLSLRDMDFITLGGRLFNDDENGQNIGNYFAEYLAQISPNTDVIILKDNYIPQGNLVIGLNSHMLFDAEQTPAPVEKSIEVPREHLMAAEESAEE